MIEKIKKRLEIQLDLLYDDMQYIMPENLLKFEDDFVNAKSNKEKIEAVYNAYIKYDDSSMDIDILKI
jgi:hypothetical protein